MSDVNQPLSREPTTTRPNAPTADRPTDTPVAHDDWVFPEGGRLDTYPFLGGHQKSAGESHLSLHRHRAVVGTPRTAMSASIYTDAPASLVAEPRLRDGDKTARVPGRAA